MGKPVTMLLHPEDLPVALERHKARLRGEPAPSAYEIRVITKDGRVCWALVTPTVIPQTHQTIISALNFTKEKEARDLLESIFLSAPISMWLAQDGRFRLVNPRLILNMGYSEAEFAEMHPLDLVYPEDREKVRRAAREMLKGRRTEPYEFRAVRKDGSITWDLGMHGYLRDLRGEARGPGLHHEHRTTKETPGATSPGEGSSRGPDRERPPPGRRPWCKIEDFAFQSLCRKSDRLPE
ncbi:MAG: PAS domain S-box protein [Deltaproteobacteria bacterium]|nr:PAS domain S-box protein [Deltaproteobacteria bacterium]